MNMIEQIKADRSSDTKQSRDRRETRITDMEAALIVAEELAIAVEHVNHDGSGLHLAHEALAAYKIAIGDTK